MRNENLKIELEKILKESDEIAERLGPEIRNRMIEIENSVERYAEGVTCLGALATGITGYASGFFNEIHSHHSHFPGLLEFMLSVMGGGVLGAMFIPIYCKIEDRAYHKLEKEFPEKAEDIQRCRGLAGSYAYLEAESNPPG